LVVAVSVHQLEQAFFGGATALGTGQEGLSVIVCFGFADAGEHEFCGIQKVLLTDFLVIIRIEFGYQGRNVRLVNNFVVVSIQEQEQRMVEFERLFLQVFED